MPITNERLDEIAKSYIDDAKIDYIGLWQIVGRVRVELGSSAGLRELREVVMQIIGKMLASGLEAVTLHSSGPGCTPWKEQGADEVIERISSEWDALGHNPSVADIVWFNDPQSS